jgi:hypothetical protein
MLGLNLEARPALAALALLDDKVPNEEAVALSPTVGWLMLIAALAVIALFILQSEAWRRWWLTAEDPRSIGLYRILFGFFVICNMNDFWEYFEFLFTDEGIFPADVVRQVFASHQFEGFGDGMLEDEPWGFFDFHAFMQYLEGPKFSLLHFWDTPSFFWAHLWVFQLCALAFMFGFWTRTMGVLTFFLMNSIFFRNHLFWEGTELVYRVFLVYLILAKCGHAYSIDNWLRCRKLRKKGLLSERDGPGGGAGIAPCDEHPKGLEAVYRLIPAWPRRLIMLQLCTVYAATGILKNGSVWAKGDAVYYAWNMDHFYRFYPQQISAIFGTNLLRVATWTTHWGEAFFSVVLIGVLVRWAHHERIPATRGLRAIAVRLCFATIVAITGALIWVTWDVHFAPPVLKQAFVGGWVVLWLVLWGLWEKMARKPFVLHGIRFRKRVFKTFREPITIDHVWVAKWILGRRIWITWHFLVMGGIFTLMNIGQFQTGMLTQAIAFFTGLEVASFLRGVGRRLGRWRVPGIPKDVIEGKPPLPSEDPTLPRHNRDAVRLPQWALFAGLGIFLIGVLVRVKVQPEWDWRWIWTLGFVFLGGVAFQRWRTARGKTLPSTDDSTQTPRPPWGYGPFGRFLAGTLIAWQIVAVATWLLPDKDSLSTWRPEARKVFTKWLTVTQTDQGWGMFAPNPPRSNVFLKVLVTDEKGEVWDMRTDVYAPERKPIPWIWNDRMRKMNRRIIGGESGNTQWYRKWYARYHCRLWQMEHDGAFPKKVDLVKVWYKIPSPEEVRQKGYYNPEELYERTKAEKIEYTEHCKRSIMGQLPNEVRERYRPPYREGAHVRLGRFIAGSLEDAEARDLPPLPDNVDYRPWLKHKKRKWENKMARQRGEKPQEQDKKRTTAAADKAADKAAKND